MSTQKHSFQEARRGQSTYQQTTAGRPKGLPQGQPPDALPALPGPVGDVSEGQGAQLVQRCLLSALQWMHDRAANLPDNRRTAWTRHLRAVQAAMRFIQQEALPLAASPSSPNSGALDPQRSKEFGALVKQARKAARLTWLELAQRAGLCKGTIRNVEAGRNVPNHSTLLRLLAVKELGLSGEQVPWIREVAADFGSSPNCWVAPDYDPIKLFTELFERLNGQGGSLEQTFAYLDHKSAVNWYQISNQSQYVSRYRTKTPVDEMARRILDETRHGKLDVIALGSGDGKQEVSLVQHLLDGAEERGLKCDIRLFLLDISQPLLSAALQHSMATLEGRGVYVCGIQGDFHHWPQYRQLHYTNERGHRRRIVCMFGNTICNLDNESRFFQHTLVGMAPNDLLLIDLGLGYGNPEKPEQIRSRDPSLSRPIPESHVEWLTGPIKRYCKDVRNVSLSYQLDRTCQLPEAYTIDAVARVQLTSGEERTFSVFRFKRYNPQRFAETLRQIGWDLIVEKPFGPDPAQPVMSALLFRRLATPAPKTAPGAKSDSPESGHFDPRS